MQSQLSRPPATVTAHPKPAPWRGTVTWALAHLRPWLVAGLVALLAFTAWREFGAIDLHSLRVELRALSWSWLAIAFGLTVLNLLAMGLYDVVALGEPAADPPLAQRLRIGSLVFAITNLMASGPLAGPALRLWLYRERGVSDRRIARCITGAMVGLWGGLAIWIVTLAALPGRYWWTGLLAAPIVASIAGVMLERVPAPAWLGNGEARHWRWLLLIGILDWALSAAAFLSVLAAAGALAPDLGHIALLFFAGQIAGLLTLVPGGLGSADAVWLWGIGTRDTAAATAAAIVAYRLVYYLIPWTLSVVVLLTEWSAERLAALKFVRTVASLMAAASGYVLILSAATPALAERLHFVSRWLPLGLLEASHAASVVFGLGLVVLSRGLRRGFREAMVLTAVLLVAGALASLAKGGDWEEALVLGGTCFLILRHHRAFARAGRLWPLLDEGAVASAIFVTMLFVAVGWWAHHRGFAPDVSEAIRAELGESAERAARGGALLLLGSAIVGLGVALRPRPPAASAAEIESALRRTLEIPQAGSAPLSVAAGDKRVWSYADRDLVLYGLTGNYLVAFRDPIATAGAEADCLEAFLAFGEDTGWDVVFYQVSPRWIPELHDQGFSLFKLGEEAIVDLRSFTLEGRRSKNLRNTLNQMDRAGVELRVLGPPEVATRMEDLRAVSEAWLQSKKLSEKRFSVGFFSEPCLKRFPAVVAERAGRILAFASLMPGAAGGEASVDLMRHRPDAPDGVMDAIFVRSFEWARERGYTRFSLGMAPLSTVGDSPRAPLWERIASFLYRHGAYFYNFQGLRQFKEKFHPGWEPRYMAYKPVWEWPRAMGAVAALIAGGWPRLVLPSRWLERASRVLAAALALAVLSAAPASTAGEAKAPALPKGVTQKRITLPAVGDATVYLPDDLSKVKRVVLFLSGDGGWNLGVVDMALRLAPSAVVAGIPTPRYQKANGARGKRCWYPAGQLETAAQSLEKIVGLPSYLRPTLVGYSSGASLVYAALAASPPTSFAGGVSLGFCPSVEITRPICGRESWHPTSGKQGGRAVQNLPPQGGPMAPWAVVHGTLDRVCSSQDVDAFVKQVPSGHLELIDGVGHGFQDASRWGATFGRSVEALPTGVTVEPAAEASGGTATAAWTSHLHALGLPLRVIPAESSERAILIFLSGDGGWADLDQSFSAALAERGVTTIGWSTLRYFWEAKAPETAAAAIGKVMAALPRGKPVFVGGYSFGADVAAYLASDLEKRARGLVMIGAGRYATFEIRPLDWIHTDSSQTPYAVTPALAATSLPWLCLSSTADRGHSGCPSTASSPLQQSASMPGGHHFGGDYEKLADIASQWMEAVLKKD